MQRTANDEERAVDQLLARTREALRAAGGDPAAVAATIRDYLRHGRELGLSPMALREHFDMSSPSVPERALLSVSQQQLASRIFDQVANELFGCAAPDPRARARKRAMLWLLVADGMIAVGVGAIAGWQQGLVALVGVPVVAVVLFVLLGPLGGPPPHQEQMLRNPDRR
jgi:hypothetical protein